ncbi:MAG: hypothetical protein Q8M64_08955, partial [Methyloversatilis sp.]|nr:hypothetical protein [Methyloversatilis sp.]
EHCKDDFNAIVAVLDEAAAEWRARGTPITLAPDEHRDWRWLPWREALDAVFSWTNRDAIRLLTQRKRLNDDRP